MRSTPFLIAPLFLLYISPLAAQSQIRKVEAYDLNGARLGMDLSEFKSKFPPVVPCQEESKNLMLCHSPSEAAWNVVVNVNDLFVDGKLAVIEVFFSNDDPRQDAIGIVERGLLSKLGTTTSHTLFRFAGKEASLERWENDVSVVQFEFHVCGNLNGKLTDEAVNIISALEGHYGVGACQLQYDRSEILYVHKELGRLAATRLNEAANQGP